MNVIKYSFAIEPVEKLANLPQLASMDKVPSRKDVTSIVAGLAVT